MVERKDDMRESKTLEFKTEISNTFLKTVSAFANYGTGEIWFGADDHGNPIGVENAAERCLDIENRINDTIKPCPEYTLNANPRNGVIVLTVFEGLHKPYLYKSKAYRRQDTATVEVDRVQLTRLILEGQNRSYESTRAPKQTLAFTLLEKHLKKQIGIESLNQDILKTLELYNASEGYTVAGELLADINTYEGIDIVRFGDSINILLDRECFDHMSILEQYDQALLFYRKHYQYEEVKGALRTKVELVPERAYREAIANALIHRTWDVKTHIRVSMYLDRIEITSPGGLPSGISEKEYLAGQLSVLRNPIIGNVFYRLNIIERFGTGIKRIIDSYRDSDAKPQFSVFENSVSIVLPIMQKHTSLENDERTVFLAVEGKIVSSSEIAEITGFGKTKVVSLLNRLRDSGYVKVIGSGRGTKYTA